MSVDVSTSPARKTLREAHAPADGLYEGARVLHRLPATLEPRPYELFTLYPLGAVIGAEISGLDLREPLTEELAAELHRALLEWKVLFFRDQPITSEQQRAFARNWGELETNPFIATGDTKDVTRFARDASNSANENIWHTDVTFRPEPAFGSVLRLIDVPPIGGDTLWADMAAAYDTLPTEIREQIDQLSAVHDVIAGFERFTEHDSLIEKQDDFPPVTHPVVRTHPETGRRMLFVNQAFTTRIVGLDRTESDRLLRRLFLQAHLPELQVRWRWTPHSIAFWDNRATQHYAANDYHPHRRVAERVAIRGDRPYR